METIAAARLLFSPRSYEAPPSPFLIGSMGIWGAPELGVGRRGRVARALHCVRQKRSNGGERGARLFPAKRGRRWLRRSARPRGLSPCTGTTLAPLQASQSRREASGARRRHGGTEQRGRAGLRRRVHPQQATPQGGQAGAREQPSCFQSSPLANTPPSFSLSPPSPQGKLEYLVKWRGWSSK